MKSFDYDLIVIGAGSGGTRAARIAAGYGAKTAVVEADKPGGTCVLRGCVPKKILIYGSEFSKNVEDAIGYCWSISDYKSNWHDLIIKKNKELDRLHQIYKSLILNSGCDLFNGYGKLISSNEVQISEENKETVISSKKIMLAVGGKSFFPNFNGNQFMINSDKALDLVQLPKSIVIYGSGYIAVEFAGIFSGFGVDTSLVFRSDYVLRGFDIDLRKRLTQQIKDRGVRIFPNNLINNIIKKENTYQVIISDNQTLESELVMGATGRKPNTDNLRLKEIGVKMGENGEVLVDDNSQTNIKSIYAIGDVTDKINLTPVAIAEGHAFSDREFGNIKRLVSYENVPCAVFSQPPISVVGLSKTEAENRGIKVKEYISEFNPLKNTISGKIEKSLMKLVVDDKDKVIGAHMLGNDAPEIIQGIAVAIKAGASKKDFDETIGIHPTAAEEFVTMK